MDQDLINYHDLCAQDSTPMDTVSSVLDMLLKSYLTQPWRTGQRIVSMSNIAATDRGILRCRLDWTAMVGELGAEFAFGDYHWQYTPEELGKVFPPTPPKACRRSAKPDHERTQYLERRGKEPWTASVRTPPGWFSDMHVDFAGLAQAIVHCDGEKLWLFWPATAKNLDWWGMQHPQPWIGHPSRLLEALDAMEGLEVMHVTDACAFIVPPFAFTPWSRSRARRTHASLSRMLRIGPWRGEGLSSAKRSFVTPCTRRAVPWNWSRRSSTRLRSGNERWD
ncbi:hypothetical protein B0H13DRAFT_2136618 [Mycena leptocephala]|nr:hypothetical protein B0H13DRAFT_2136618 [Mycena leptocephala]